MGLLAMLTQALAMVRDQHDKRVARRARAVERGQQTRHLGVDERDLPVIRTAGMAGAKIFRRIVRRMRIKEVEPEEEGPRALPAQPGESPIDPLVRTAGRMQELVERGIGRRPVVVVGEAAVEPEGAMEDESGDERRGVVAGHGKPLGQGGGRRGGQGHAVVDHAVVPGFDPGQESPVRRESQRDGGEGVLETNARAGESIDRRGFHLRGAIAAEPVGAQGVDRDEQHVARRRRCGGAAREDPCQQQEESSRDGVPNRPQTCRAHQSGAVRPSRPRSSSARPAAAPHRRESTTRR